MKNLFLLVVCTGCCFFAEAQQRQWKQQVAYIIDAQLNTRNHTLDGFLRLQYTNHSPDTLYYLWFQLWPNAYKNDRTDFSEHLLNIGRNDFYFAGSDQRGYINRLEFRSGNDLLKQTEDSLHIDLARVVLSTPLLPEQSVSITTPFHVKLPYAFDSIGHTGHAYRVAGWFPAVAVYDSSGWHPAPYSGQRTSSAETGALDITLQLPRSYTIKAGGALKDDASADSTRTLHFIAENAGDFPWSANPAGYTPGKAKKKNDLTAGVDTLLGKALKKNWLPAIGYNQYDGLQIGALAQNISDSDSRVTYFISTLYAVRSGRITGVGAINYSWYPNNRPFPFITRADAGLNISAFSIADGVDSNGKKIFAGFYKLAPYLKLTLPARSRHADNSLEWKTFIIGEQDFQYLQNSTDSFYYPVRGSTDTRYLNQLTYHHVNDRSLYPYSVQLQVQQAKNFYRVNAEAHYFFNYPGGGGMQVRAFAAKFGYLGAAGPSKKFETTRYQPKLTAVTGTEDYTYSDYFIGRNEFDGFASRQMMLRDGGLKIRTDQFQDLQGRSDNWVASMNLNTTLPSKLFPPWFPVRLFLDAGTYSGAWKKGSALPRFLYVAGVQLSLLKNIVNIYAPLMYSREFKDNLKTIPEQNTFLKRVSFSIDIHRLKLVCISRHKPFIGHE